MKRSGKLFVATLCIVATLLILTPASAQYSFGSPCFGSGNFNPIAYFRPVSIGGGHGFPGFGPDPFNPFIYGGVRNPVSFPGPGSIGIASNTTNVSSLSKGNEKNLGPVKAQNTT